MIPVLKHLSYVVFLSFCPPHGPKCVMQTVKGPPVLLTNILEVLLICGRKQEAPATNLENRIHMLNFLLLLVLLFFRPCPGQLSTWGLSSRISVRKIVEGSSDTSHVAAHAQDGGLKQYMTVLWMDVSKLLQRLRLHECVWLFKDARSPPSVSNPLLSCLTGKRKQAGTLRKSNTQKKKLMKNN